MAFYTKPVSPTKGQDNQVTLDKSQLVADSIVSADSYFSDSSNWKYVVVSYQSTEGSQLEKVSFNVVGPSTTVNSSFKVSDKARDTFEVQSVTIYDFDGGYLKLSRDQLVVADFDIAFGITSSIAFDPINTESNVTLSNNNRTATLSTTNGGIAKSEVWTTVKDVTGPSYIEYTVEDVSSPFFLGLVASNAAFDGADLTSLDRLTPNGGLRVAISINSDGTVYVGGSGIGYGFISSLNIGDIVTLAYDGPDAYVAVNGVWVDGFLPESTNGVNIGIGSLINAGIEFEQNGNGVVGTSVSINQTPSIVLPSYTYIGS